MLPDRVSNPGPLTYESGALLIALRGPAPQSEGKRIMSEMKFTQFPALFVDPRVGISLSASEADG